MEEFAQQSAGTRSVVVSQWEGRVCSITVDARFIVVQLRTSEVRVPSRRSASRNTHARIPLSLHSPIKLVLFASLLYYSQAT
jgi:hypothetical protein